MLAFVECATFCTGNFMKCRGYSNATRLSEGLKVLQTFQMSFTKLLAIGAELLHLLRMNADLRVKSKTRKHFGKHMPTMLLSWGSGKQKGRMQSSCCCPLAASAQAGADPSPAMLLGGRGSE